jgi:AraC-like DNA-binding protein
MLCETDLPIKTIARRTGFSSEYYLSIAFKRIVGMAPWDYRRNTKKVFLDGRIP